MKGISKKLIVNEQIKDREVRLIDTNGDQLGIVPIEEALDIARKKNLDLVNVAPMSRPPVCRIMDFGKYKYEQSKREREARKHQKLVTVKEVKLRPNIEDHDFNVKLKNAIRFLQNGDKVKITVTFRGREITHPQQGRILCNRMAQEIKEYAVIEKESRLEGRNMVMIVAPKSKIRG